LNNCRKGLVHVCWWSELGDLSEPAIDLITHGRNNIVNRYPILLIDEGLDPNLGVDLLASLEVLADVILLLGDRAELLRAVDVDARH